MYEDEFISHIIQTWCTEISKVHSIIDFKLLLVYVMSDYKFFKPIFEIKVSLKYMQISTKNLAI